ncbi:MAG TPA: hypothetical protein VKM94_20285 [Blastocatellia bacterium]|nr:hypothetical protein [Blastocatellia bacterium]
MRRRISTASGSERHVKLRAARYRLLDAVIAVRAGELLGLCWLDFRPEQQA